jgi:hypothetical protein
MYLSCRELLPRGDAGSLSWLCDENKIIWDDLYMEGKLEIAEKATTTTTAVCYTSGHGI